MKPILAFAIFAQLLTACASTGTELNLREIGDFITQSGKSNTAATADNTSTKVATSPDTSMSADTTKPVVAGNEKLDDKEQLLQQNEEIIKRYVGSVLKLAEAQIEFSEAIDEKEQSERLRAESKALGSASHVDKDSLEQQATVSRNTNDAIQKKLDSKTKLDTEQRKKFSLGMLHYVLALKETKEFTDQIEPFYKKSKDQIEAWKDEATKNPSKTKWEILIDTWGSIEIFFNDKFKVTRYIVEESPRFMNDHRNTVQKIIAYAKSNDIEIPKEVEEINFI